MISEAEIKQWFIPDGIVDTPEFWSQKTRMSNEQRVNDIMAAMEDFTEKKYEYPPLTITLDSRNDTASKFDITFYNEVGEIMLERGSDTPPRDIFESLREGLLNLGVKERVTIHAYYPNVEILENYCEDNNIPRKKKAASLLQRLNNKHYTHAQK